MKALLLGNGKTRIGLDLAGYKSSGIVIAGCNALYRDFMPDILCVADGNMYSEVVSAGVLDKASVLWVDKNYKPWRTMLSKEKVSKQLGQHDGAKAGPTLGHWLPFLYPEVTDVFLVGMDLGAASKATNNNVYENTRNYAPSWNVKAHLVYSSEDEVAWRNLFLRHPRITWHWLKPSWRKKPLSWPTTVLVHESQKVLDSVLRGSSVPA